MKNTRTILAIVAILLAAGSQTRAAEPTGSTHATGRQQAVDRILAATSEQTKILTDLLATLPDNARSKVEDALTASATGEAAAVAALQKEPGQAASAAGTDSPGASADRTEPQPPDASSPDASSADSTSDETEPAPTGNPANHGKPDQVGLDNARAQVEASFQKSLSALEDVKTRVPAQTVPKIDAAIQHVQANRQIAMDNLDQLSMERVEKPERPDRPERIDRPERAQRPDRPERPDHPSPPGN